MARRPRYKAGRVTAKTARAGGARVPVIVSGKIVTGTPPVVPPSPTDQWGVNGIPPLGKTLAGASCGGRDTVAMTNMETLVGAQAGLWRVYHNPGTASAVAADATWAHSQGMVPWISVKVPTASWGSAATTGSYDSWAQGIANALGALDGPVWIALNHEPEGDGVDADWKAMQNRLLPIFQAKPNIATSIILTGWNERYGGVGWDYWCPDPANFTIYGIDPYLWYATEKTEGSGMRYAWDEELVDYYSHWNAWKTSKGAAYAHLRLGVAETAYANIAASYTGSLAPNNDGASWLTRAYADLKAINGVGLAYFNVSAAANNEPVSWTWLITSEPKITKMREMLQGADVYSAYTPPPPNGLTPSATLVPSSTLTPSG